MTPQAMDSAALGRRVLLTALVSVVLFVATGVALFSVGAPQWMALPVAVLVYAFVVRPMMRPVQQALRLRRDLAYQAFTDQRATDEREHRA